MSQEISEKDRLDTIFKLQKGLSEMMNLDRYPKDSEGRVSALCTAIMHEAVELQRQQIGNGGKHQLNLMKLKQEKN